MTHALTVDATPLFAGLNAAALRTLRARSIERHFAADEVLFIANHAFDCIGAKAAGMRTAFIDRRERPFGATPHQPDLLVPSMAALADAMA